MIKRNVAQGRDSIAPQEPPGRPPGALWGAICCSYEDAPQGAPGGPLGGVVIFRSFCVKCTKSLFPIFGMSRHVHAEMDQDQGRLKMWKINFQKSIQIITFDVKMVLSCQKTIFCHIMYTKSDF